MRKYLKNNKALTLFRIMMLSLILFSSGIVHGQGKLDFAGISYTNTPYSKLENIPDNVPDLDEFGIGVEQLQFFITVPVKISDNLILSFVPNYELTSFSYENDDLFDNGFRADRIHKIQLGTNLTWRVKDSLIITFFNNPNISSDLRESLSGDDFFNQPGVIVHKKINKKLTLGLGLVASFVFGEQNVFPILSLRYFSENEKFLADVNFPNARLTYKVHEKVGLGFITKLRGNEYNFVNRAIVGTMESTDYIKFTNILMGPELTYNLTELFDLRLSTGINTGRKFEVFDTKGDNIGDITPEAAGFFGASLIFKVPTEQEKN